MAKKKGLGNIYDDIFDDDINIFGDDNDSGEKLVSYLKLNDIEPNRNQPRKDFDSEKLSLLAESIATHGIIQPLTVRPLGDVYQIVAGERRWRAARIAGLSEVPVRVMELSDSQTMQIALIENLQREDLNPIEEALGYQELMDNYHMKQEEIAKGVGKARSSITNSIRLLTMPDEVIQLVRNGEISKGHCKALMGARSDKEMIDLANRAIKTGMSVRSLENLVRNSNEEKTSPEPTKKSTFLTEAELALLDVLKYPVRINNGKKKITIEIDVENEEQVKEIVNKLGELKND